MSESNSERSNDLMDHLLERIREIQGNREDPDKIVVDWDSDLLERIREIQGNRQGNQMTIANQEVPDKIVVDWDSVRKLYLGIELDDIE